MVLKNLIKNQLSYKKPLKLGFSVKRYSDRFLAIKSLNLIGFLILKMRLICRDDLQPLEMIDLTYPLVYFISVIHRRVKKEQRRNLYSEVEELQPWVFDVFIENNFYDVTSVSDD